MDALYFTALALLGAAFGSFANVVIYRFPLGESLSTPASHCPRCDHPIRPYDNIPVLSWLILRGRCRDCGEPISIRYPLVELSSAGLWLLAGVLFGSTMRTGVAIAFFYGLLILAMIDIDTGRLPNPIVASIGLTGVIGVVLAVVAGVPAAPLTAAVSTNGLAPVWLAVAGVLAGGGMSLGLALLYEYVRKREGFGMGDVKLLAAMGPFLGPYVVLAFFGGSILHILAFIGLRVLGRPMSPKAPFGPALAAAGVLTAVFGAQFWAWYTGLLVTGP